MTKTNTAEAICQEQISETCLTYCPLAPHCHQLDGESEREMSVRLDKVVVELGGE